MSRNYFGTDGIRGTVGQYPITPDFMLAFCAELRMRRKTSESGTGVRFAFGVVR